MTSCAQITQVKYLGERNLLISFNDGLQRLLAFHSCWQGVTEPLNSNEFLAMVQVDPITKSLTWPDGIDLDAEILHGDFVPVNGDYFTVLSEEKLL